MIYQKHIADRTGNMDIGISELAFINIMKKFGDHASWANWRKYENNVDLFVGGSPCQSFSLVGKQRGLEDTRGTLFYEYARLVSEILSANLAKTEEICL